MQVPEDRDGFKFRSGRLALDLAATVAMRLKPERRELLETTDDLARWFRSAGLAPKPLSPTGDQLDDARRLREAIYRLALACIAGEAFAAKDRAVLNELASRPTPTPMLSSQRSVTWSESSTDAALAVVARDGIELLGGPLAAQVRKCEGATCALLFVDQSRAGQRRWCSMAVCGNKAKVAKFRAS